MDMDRKNCYCVILAGGSGTRFWPISTVSKPKQFLPLHSEGKTLLRSTYERYLELVPKENIIVVTARRYENYVREVLPDVASENILYEPYTRNTAPSVTYATYTLLKRNPDAVLIVTPSDHIIDNDDEFKETVRFSFDYANENDVLLTFGIVPTRPDTNYGYVQAVGGYKAFVKLQPKKVKTFTEKPDVELAKVFMKSGEFYWNAGVFTVKAEVMKEELETHLPEVTALFANWENVLGTPVEQDFIERAYTDCANISIGFAVMEKTGKSWILPVRFGWADIGTWESLYELLNKDDNGNVLKTGKSLTAEAHNNLVISTSKDKLVAIKGLENFMVVETDDALIICPKDDRKYKDFISGIAMPGFEKYR